MSEPRIVKYWAQQKNIVPHDHYVRSQIGPMKLREVYLAADVDALVQDFHRVLTQTYIDLRDVNCELGRDAAKHRLDLEIRLLAELRGRP